MKLIKNQDEWLDFATKLPESYNIDGRVLGTPTEYPCLVISRPQMDGNGYNVVCNFVYKADAVKLLNCIKHGES